MADAPPVAGQAPRGSRLRSGQVLSVTAGALILVALLGLVVSLVALRRLTDARTLVVDRVDPARLAAAQLQIGYLDEETAIRGYALTGQRLYLDPYRKGQREVVAARAELQLLLGSGSLRVARGDLAAVEQAAARWHREYADRVITGVRQQGDRAPLPTLTTGKTRFDSIRAAVARLDDQLAAQRADGRGDLRGAARTVRGAVLFAGALLLASALAAALVLRRVVSVPLARLAEDARRVADGDFDRPVAIEGPRDVAALSSDIESMRRRIVADLAAVSVARQQLEEQTVDLQRSNAELEQFAYVASHDLQEPLRKVASFCGMLERRYKGQLDERADQYIAFAVDGAKRMQVLINDLLAFSRVGRVGVEAGVVELDAAVAEAQDNLATAIEESGATVTVDGPLPTVRGDASLLTGLFQNLIGNAIKFRGDEPPRVRIGVERDGELWRFSVDDNGIGIDQQYAERIFVIFQRLHPKDEYSGTGIGLAMCRKIVEYHGGTIWLDPHGADGGASFHFTLPAISEEEANA